MTLPEVCPIDENKICKGRECHLFCLEWRTREPICLIGYSTTSKVKCYNDGLRKDTYAEETFRKLGRQPLSKKRNVSGKGDWTPSKPMENPRGEHLKRREEVFTQAPNFQEASVKSPELKPEKDQENRLKERYASSEAEKASHRLEARLKKEIPEQQSIIYGKAQSGIQERPKPPERIISRDRHTTIITSCNADEKKNPYLSDREKEVKKNSENKEKRKNLDEVMEIDLPDVKDEEFWS